MKFYKIKNLPIINKILTFKDPKIVKISTCQLKEGDFKTLVKVGDFVKVGSTILIDKNQQKILSSISGKVTKIKTEKDIFNNLAQFIEIENDEKNEHENFEKQNLKTKENLIDLCLNMGLASSEFYLVNYFKNLEENNLYLNVTYNDYNFINKIIFLNYKQKITNVFNLLIKILDIKNVYINCNKSDIKLIKNLVKNEYKNVNFNFNKNKKNKSLNLVDLLNIYNAISGIPQTNIFVYFVGGSLKKNALINMPNGTKISDVKALPGGFKSDIEEIENFKYTAMLAYNDEMVLKDKIKKCKNKEDRLKLKKLLKEKRDEAHKNIYSNLKEYHEKYLNSLSCVVVNDIDDNMCIKDFEKFIQYDVNVLSFLSKKEFH